MAHHHIDPLSGLSSSSQAENSPSPPNHAPPPGTFATALAVLQEDQQANLFITPEPSSSLEQAILAVNTTNIAVDRFPLVSPNTALTMHMVNTNLPAFTVAREPTPSIHSSPSPVSNTRLPLPLTEAPLSGDNLTSSAPASSHPVASWEGCVEEARVTNFPTSSDIGFSMIPSITSPGMHDSASHPQGVESDVDMSSEFSDAGADLLVRQHLFPAQGQSLSTVHEDTPAFLGVPPPLSQGCLDRITSWQNSLSFEGESAATDAMYKAVEEIIKLHRGYAEFFVDNSLHFLKGSVLESVTRDDSDNFTIAPSLQPPATMLEALQFMVGQLSELLLPDSGALPRASVEGICAQIWETHESALRAELEERASRLRARLDPDRFASVIDQVLASPSSHTLPEAVSSALTEQFTEELRSQLGQ